MPYLPLIIFCIGLRILRKGEDPGIIGWTGVYLLSSREVHSTIYDSIREIFPTYFNLDLWKNLFRCKRRKIFQNFLS